MNQPRALVLRAPGINCDRETAHACRLVGFDTDLLHINQLIQTPQRLLDYHLLVIPGGFSYGDDLGAGTLLAKNLIIHLGPQVRQFIAEGRLVLGICNGFQVLVRAGLLPGYINPPQPKALHPSRGISAPAGASRVEGGGVGLSAHPSRELPSHTPLMETGVNKASLTDNASARFECRWVTLAVQPGRCIFTRDIERPIELPVAHGEGQFVLADESELARLQAHGQVSLIYSGEPGKEHETVPYPANPNGSIGNIAGICNAQGNVFGLMPHPERYVQPLQHPQRKGTSGDGLLIFQNAYLYSIKNWSGSRVTAGKEASSMETQLSSYAASGVDISAADRAKALMKEAVRSTQGRAVLAGMGAFAGVLDASNIQQMHRPALVASTDGVGTKTLLAAQARRFDTIGHDLVNHSVNDLLTQGARPLFFMDYLAMGRLDAVQAAQIVRSVATACQEVGCALLGGETAEMPDVYLPGAFDLAGTIVGIVEQNAIPRTDAICAGDILLGLPSSGLHTNGYSLARRVFASYPLDTVFPELGEPLVDALLRPHRCYLREIEQLQGAGLLIKGMAHITGGGFEGNITRVLPENTRAVLETGAWNIPLLFQLLARLGHIPQTECYRTFNMGIGIVLIVSPEAAERARLILPELLTIGRMSEGNGVVFV